MALDPLFERRCARLAFDRAAILQSESPPIDSQRSTSLLVSFVLPSWPS